MSIALESNSNRIEGSGFHGMSCISIFDSTETGRSMAGILAGGRNFLTDNMPTTATKVEEQEELLDSSSSSSIGRNSDLSGMSDGEGSGETEVQSSYKGPLDTMDALEEVLPIRRGISRFYRGKSKSFTSLADASSSSSMKEIAKPENAYNRKRKNLLAFNNLCEKNRNFPLRSNGGGVSKRPTTNSSRSTLALAVAMNSSSESNNTSENNSNSTSPSPPRLHLPPLHPLSKPCFNKEPWRSFSLTDLQCVATATNTNSLPMSNRDKHKKLY